MEEKTMQQLKDEAAELGIDVKGIKSKDGIQSKIDEFNATESEAATAVEEDVTEEEAPVDGMAAVRSMVPKLKRDAMKTRVVKIINNDKRDNHLTTTCYLSAENQYFGISKIVPLDTPVELEQCLIDTAKAVEISRHVDDGTRSGNQEVQIVKKYSISYEDIA